MSGGSIFTLILIYISRFANFYGINIGLDNLSNQIVFVVSYNLNFDCISFKRQGSIFIYSYVAIVIAGRIGGAYGPIGDLSGRGGGVGKSGH